MSNGIAASTEAVGNRYNNTRSFNAEDNKRREKDRVRRKLNSLKWRMTFKASGTTTRER